ncbi:MAG: insulinase family protein [Armatimonadetes bacterium]|nr:insulinase family protein [Armatimonadota bacterium]
MGKRLSGRTARPMTERALGPVREQPHATLSSDVTKRVLDNGLTVLVKEVYPASIVNLAIWVKVGSIHEEDKEAGISHCIEHMLFKGTRKRAVGEIAKEIHGVGGYLNAFTSYDCTCYWVVLPSKYFDIALDVEADALLNSTLDQEELEKEIRVILEEIKMYQDRPDSHCFEKLMEIAYTRHPYRRPIIGYENVLKSVTPQDLFDYWERFYRPGNMFVTLVGDVHGEKCVDKISRYLGSMKPGLVPLQERNREPEQRERREISLNGDIQKTHVQIAFHIPDALHKDTYACQILAGILGEGRSARLNQSLKEKKRLVTAIDAGLFSQKEPGLFLIQAVLDDGDPNRATSGIRDEIEKLIDEGVTTDELNRAKNIVESSYVFGQETVEGLGKNLGFYEILGDYALSDRYIEELYKVKAEEVCKAAGKYLTDSNCSIAVYRPNR